MAKRAKIIDGEKLANEINIIANNMYQYTSPSLSYSGYIDLGEIDNIMNERIRQAVNDSLKDILYKIQNAIIYSETEHYPCALCADGATLEDVSPLNKDIV